MSLLIFRFICRVACWTALPWMSNGHCKHHMLKTKVIFFIFQFTNSLFFLYSYISYLRLWYLHQLGHSSQTWNYLRFLNFFSNQSITSLPKYLVFSLLFILASIDLRSILTRVFVNSFLTGLWASLACLHLYPLFIFLPEWPFWMRVDLLTLQLTSSSGFLFPLRQISGYVNIHHPQFQD